MSTTATAPGKKQQQGQQPGSVSTHQPFFTVARGVWGMKDIFVNFYMVEDRSTKEWVLIDAGLVTSCPKIKAMAKTLFGEKKPTAIILTHAHFDHRGSVKKLANEWKVPVYAHYMELPYLTGKSSYPPPDPTVGGGMMAAMAPLYPDGPIDITGMVTPLPQDGTVPGLQDWRFIHTPGHAPGHISLFREGDRVLIAGDAVVTTKQEALSAVATQKLILSGPPKYFTYDWQASKQSLKKIIELKPDVLATGHGKPMFGDKVVTLLKGLYDNFDKVAVPQHGRYVDDAAYADEAGVHYVPPKDTRLIKYVAAGVLAVGLAAAAYYVATRTRKKQTKLQQLTSLLRRYTR